MKRPMCQNMPKILNPTRRWIFISLGRNIMMWFIYLCAWVNIFLGLTSYKVGRWPLLCPRLWQRLISFSLFIKYNCTYRCAFAWSYLNLVKASTFDSLFYCDFGVDGTWPYKPWFFGVDGRNGTFYP